MKTINIKTSNENQMLDITSDVREVVRESNIKSGLCIVFVPHTTAAITINENADFSVKEDMINGLNRISPNLEEYKHFEGNSDAHIKSSLIGVDQTIIIEDGELVLGTWQGIYLCEFDGPRNRQVHIKLI